MDSNKEIRNNEAVDMLWTAVEAFIDYQICHIRKTSFEIYIPVSTVLHRNRFILNNQPDALIIQILFCYKTLHVSGIFSAHHQEFSTVNSALLSFMQV